MHDDENQALGELGNYKAALILGSDKDERFNPDAHKVSERFKKGDVVRLVLGDEPQETEKSDEDQAESIATSNWWFRTRATSQTSL